MTMFQITVTMDRVYSMARFTTKNHTYTEFGFQSAGKNYFGVQVPGAPRIEEGMTVTMLLREEGDWTSVCGWVDMRTGEVTAPGVGEAVFVALVLLLISLFVAIGTRDPVVCLFCIPPVLMYPLAIVPRQRICRALEEIYAKAASQSESTNRD